MKRIINRARRHCAVFLSFSAIQAMQLILPLLALPWLARMLSPDSFGLLMYFCLYPPLVAMLVDWGMAYSGARDCAWARGDSRSLSDLLGAAIAAKALLIFLCGLLAYVLLPFLPHAQDHSIPYFLAICAGASRGLNPVWFFQGAGSGMSKAAIFDTVSSALVLGLTFLYIRESGDWPLYLLFLSVCKGGAYILLLWKLWATYRPAPKMEAAIKLMRRSAPLFGANFAQLLCYNGGQLGLGYFLPAYDMGIIVAVAKMLRAFVSLINPFTQTLFPELCIMRKTAPERACRILRWSLTLTSLAAIAGSAICWVLAPWLIGVGLGNGYQSAVTVLRIASVAAPIMAVNNVLSNQILTPFGLEKRQLAVQACGAFLAMPLGALLGWHGLIFGACLPVCIETLLLGGFTVTILTSGRHAFPGLK